MTADTASGANPNVTRSRLVLEIASEMAGSAASDAVPTYVQPRVVLRHAGGGKAATFLGVSTAEGIFAVASREADLAMIYPAAVLSVGSAPARGTRLRAAVLTTLERRSRITSLRSHACFISQYSVLPG